MLDNVEAAFKKLTGRQRRTARRMVKKAGEAKGSDRFRTRTEEAMKYILKHGS